MRMPPLRDVDKNGRMFHFHQLRMYIPQMLAEVVSRMESGLEDVASREIIDTIAHVSQLIRYLDYQEIMALVTDQDKRISTLNASSSSNKAILERS